jgi:hypothetical protein
MSSKRPAARRGELVLAGCLVNFDAPNRACETCGSRTWVDEASTGGFQGETLELTTEIMFGKTTRNDPSKQPVVSLWKERISRLPLSLRPAMSGVIERDSALPLLPT